MGKDGNEPRHSVFRMCRRAVLPLQHLDSITGRKGEETANTRFDKAPLSTHFLPRAAAPPGDPAPSAARPAARASRPAPAPAAAEATAALPARARAAAARAAAASGGAAAASTAARSRRPIHRRPHLRPRHRRRRCLPRPRRWGLELDVNCHGEFSFYNKLGPDSQE